MMTSTFGFPGPGPGMILSHTMGLCRAHPTYPALTCPPKRVHTVVRDQVQRPRTRVLVVTVRIQARSITAPMLMRTKNAPIC